MQRVRGAVFFVLIGTVIIAVLAARATASPQATADSNSVVVAPVTDSPTQQSVSTAPPLLPDEDAYYQPSPTAYLLPDDPTPTPPSIYASELQGMSQPDARAPLAESTDSPEEDWNPPSLAVPLARHPYDHYWFIRPVTSNYTNYGLSWYPYGSNGPGNNLRIHHGVDISNPVGVEVHAAADGTVIWAGRGHENQFERITAYGNTAVIQHDFGYRGQPIYTLYAHLSAILVREGDRVATGQVIGLIGATGQVSGPHVHFEVRLGRDWYYAVRNPSLWMAPYVGTGVIAGRIESQTHRPVNDAAVSVLKLPGGRTVYETTTYGGFGVNSDDNWNENFVIPDVPVGEYLVVATSGDRTWSGQVEVREGLTNWVDMQLQLPEDSGS